MIRALLASFAILSLQFLDQTCANQKIDMSLASVRYGAGFFCMAVYAEMIAVCLFLFAEKPCPEPEERLTGWSLYWEAVGAARLIFR